VKRLDGGQRVYTDDDVRRLKFIQKLKVLVCRSPRLQESNALRSPSTNDKCFRADRVARRTPHDVSERLGELTALRDEIRPMPSRNEAPRRTK